MRISQKRLAAMKGALRRGGANAAKGAKGSAISAAVGVASYFGYEFLGNQSKTLVENWWAAPAVLAAGGHFLKRKNHDIGVAMLGAAGFMGAMNFRVNQAREKSKTPAPQAQGFYDAGALENAFAELASPSDAGAFAYDENAGTSAYADARGYDDAGYYDADEAMGLVGG
jgi:hypothetical protein